MSTGEESIQNCNQPRTVNADAETTSDKGSIIGNGTTKTTFSGGRFTPSPCSGRTSSCYTYNTRHRDTYDCHDHCQTYGCCNDQYDARTRYTSNPELRLRLNSWKNGVDPNIRVNPCRTPCVSPCYTRTKNKDLRTKVDTRRIQNAHWSHQRQSGIDNKLRRAVLDYRAMCEFLESQCGDNTSATSPACSQPCYNTYSPCQSNNPTQYQSCCNTYSPCHSSKQYQYQPCCNTYSPCHSSKQSQNQHGCNTYSPCHSSKLSEYQSCCNTYSPCHSSKQTHRQHSPCESSDTNTCSTDSYSRKPICHPERISSPADPRYPSYNKGPYMSSRKKFPGQANTPDVPPLKDIDRKCHENIGQYKTRSTSPNGRLAQKRHINGSSISTQFW